MIVGNQAGLSNAINSCLLFLGFLLGLPSLVKRNDDGIDTVDHERKEHDETGDEGIALIAEKLQLHAHVMVEVIMASFSLVVNRGNGAHAINKHESGDGHDNVSGLAASFIVGQCRGGLENVATESVARDRHDHQTKKDAFNQQNEVAERPN